MNKLRLMLMMASMLMLFALCAFQAQAQATRTWVSGVGDDANPCSRTAPCKTIAGAISKTAAGGEINAIDSGGFGTVTITKSITIDFSSVEGSILASGTTGIFINGTDIVVNLHGLSINGAGTTLGVKGIRILNAKTVSIENTRIFGFSNAGISEERSTGGTLFINNSIIKDNGNANISMTTSSNPGVRAFLDNVQLKNGQAGISVANGNTASITNSFINGNSLYGIVAFGTNSTVTAKNTSIAGNQTGIGITNGNPVIRISDLLITQNITSLFISGSSTGQILSFGDNKISGNQTENPPTGTISQQ